MTRRKMKLAFIANNSKRKASYKIRKQSLLKKTEELTTLCGIEACAIVYSPYDHEPQIWPSESGVQNVLRKFMTVPEWEKNNKMANQESFIAQTIVKRNEKMAKLVKENNETEMTMFMCQCLNTGRVQSPDNMTSADLNVLSSVIEQKLNDISTRLELLKVQPQMQTLASQSQMQTLPNQPKMQTLDFQPQTQTTAQAVEPEETTPLNNGNGPDMNANPMQSQQFMNLLNGNGDETILPPFGDANLQL